ncbi:MAG: metallophosphoesterase [Anaerolineaceae bacterium]
MRLIIYKSVICLPQSGLVLLVILIALTGCSSSSPTPVRPPSIAVDQPSSQATLPPTEMIFSSPTPETILRFAVIGDYGIAGDDLRQVANMVVSWTPDLIITTGDNNYPEGSPDTIDENIGQYFHEFIASYRGDFGTGADINRFFPSLGNHDWITSHAQPYLDYFTLPGNERYYDFIRGDVHFFALDSDTQEPDGVGRSSKQAQWLQTSLAVSTSPWNVVFTHYPPYSSGYHGSTDWMLWPYKQWGASIVLAGHDHDYERLIVDDFPYLVIGLSGNGSYPFVVPLPGSQLRHSYDQCAILAVATAKYLGFELICVPDILVDSFMLQKTIQQPKP